MAVISLDFYSKELKMSTLVTIIVPDSIRIEDIPVSKRKCLTFLHGLSDDGTSCLRLSKIELYAMETGLVVVMPSVGRSMYCDNVNGQNYFTHVAKEIPEYLELVFGLSRKKQDNYIAGISMGGMGAAKVALTYPDHFAGVALFSGLLDVKMMLPNVTEDHQREFPFIYSEAANMDHTPLNPINLLDKEKHKDLEILVRCGKQDDLYMMSQAFYQKAKDMQLNVTSIFEDGAHEWRLWDRYLDDYVKIIAGNTGSTGDTGNSSE